MDEIVLNGECWTAHISGGDFRMNLVRRLEALKIEFNINQNHKFDWDFNYSIKTPTTCLCGKNIIEINILVKDNQKIQIGSSCVKNFFPETVKADMIKARRLTFDCDDCNKKIRKTNVNHGHCKDCNKDIRCYYTKCYNCIRSKLDKFCSCCGKKINPKYSKCYKCQFSM